MAEKTAIEWADSTFNPWVGCTRVGPGCDNCYAAVSTPSRSMGIKWGAGEERHRTSASTWAQPLKWERNAQAFQAKHGRRQRVFCASLADVFDNEVDPVWRSDLFKLIGDTPNLDWLLLTKRIGNAKEMISDAVRSLYWEDESGEGVSAPEWPWSHVWLGATVVNQAEYDRDIGKLLRTPARVHFLSVEPMLGPIDLRKTTAADRVRVAADVKKYGGPEWQRPIVDMLDWVIGGFESGHHARPGNPAWARSLRDQCAAAGTAFLWKQNGEWAPGSLFPDGIPSGTSCDFDGDLKTDDERVWKVGKKAAGRMLDGVEHNGFPS